MQSCPRTAIHQLKGDECYMVSVLSTYSMGSENDRQKEGGKLKLA